MKKGGKWSQEAINRREKTRKENDKKRGYHFSPEAIKNRCLNHWDCSGKNNPNYETKWICSSTSGEVLKVSKDKVQEYLINGWVLGRGNQIPKGDKHPHFGKTYSRERVERGIQTRREHDIKNGYHHSPQSVLKMLSSAGSHPNKFETNALNYLNTVYPNKFKYTGDGTMIINNRSADAYSEELNTIALFNGYYWHLKKFGFEVNDKAKGAVQLIEAMPFVTAGYRVIFIWEDELNKIIKKLNKGEQNGFAQIYCGNFTSY